MKRRFDDQISIDGGTPTKLLEAMIAKNFTLTPMATYLVLTPVADIYIGNSAAVDSSNGKLVKADADYTESTSGNDIVDLTQIWIYSATNTTVHVQCRGK